MSDEHASTPRLSMGVRIARGLAWAAGSLLLLLILVAAGAAWYTTTADFQRRVGKEVVSVLEDSTGGKSTWDELRLTSGIWRSRRMGW